MMDMRKTPIVLPELRISRCSFENCHSETDGGAVDAYKIQSILEDVNFRNNRATRAGGALLLSGSAGSQAFGNTGANACM